MRIYEPVWITLKTSPYGTLVKVEAEKARHARIIKAVIKEKWLDVEFKFVAGERGEQPRLAYSVEGNVITFTLSDFNKRLENSI